MARAWGTISYGQSQLRLTGGLGATRTVTATHAGGTTYPNAHVNATSITVNISEATSGAGPPSGQWGIAVVEDAGEANQNYAVAGVVLAYVALGAGGSLPASVNVPGLSKGGQYRLVLMAGDSAAHAQSNAGVNTGGLSSEYHHDSDGGTTEGGTAPSASLRTVGAAGHRVTPTAVTPTAGNWRYGQTNQIAFSIRPAASTGSAVINPKQLKLALSTDAAGATRPDGVYRVTPNATGDVTAAGITVDTDFNQALGGIDHYVQAGVNNTLGDSTTPAAEAASDYSIGTVVGVTTSQRSPYVFEDGTVTENVSTSQVRSNTASVKISAAIQLFQDAGLSQAGVATFNDSGRTIPNRLFNRRMSASVDGPHGRAFCRGYIADGYGVALVSTSMSVQLRDSDGTVEASQTLSTGAGGVVNWENQFSATDKAFNAFRRTGADDPDALGAHDINIVTADVYKPPGTKTGAYSDPKVPTTERSFSAAVFPGRAKDYAAVGNVFSGVKEPSAVAADVLALCSEIIYAGMFSGSAGDLETDANGVPTGVSSRGKPTAAGSFFCKLTSEINEANGTVIDPAAHNPTDRAGRPLYPSTVELVGRRALFDRGLTGLPVDTGTSLALQQNQQTPLGYSIHGTPSQTFDAVSAPTDATTFGYYQGFSNLSATRDSFGLNAGAPEVAGFTVDSGLFGYKQQVLQYTVIRDDLLMEIVTSPQTPSPGQNVRAKIKAWQVLPDKTRIEKDFDDAPVVYLDSEGGGGVAMMPLQVFTATPIGAVPTSDYEVEFASPSPTAGTRESFGLIAFGVISGAKVLTTSSFSIGNRDQNIILVSDVANGDGAKDGAHLVGGNPIEVVLKAANKETDTFVPFDTSPPPTFAILRKIGDGTTEYWNNTTKLWVAGTPFVENLLTLQPGNIVASTLIDGADTVSWGNSDVQVFCTASIGGVIYADRTPRELVGPSFQHDRDESQNTGLVYSVYDAGGTERKLDHLRFANHDLEILAVPRNQDGVNEGAVLGPVEFSLRKVRDGLPVQDYDGDTQTWVDSTGPFIFFTAGATQFPNGAGSLRLSAAELAFSGTETAWIIASARFTYDPGAPEERVKLETVQIPVFGLANGHTKFKFDPTGLYK